MSDDSDGGEGDAVEEMDADDATHELVRPAVGCVARVFTDLRLPTQAAAPGAASRYAQPEKKRTRTGRVRVLVGRQRYSFGSWRPDRRCPPLQPVGKQRDDTKECKSRLEDYNGMCPGFVGRTSKEIDDLLEPVCGTPIARNGAKSRFRTK